MYQLPLAPHCWVCPGSQSTAGVLSSGYEHMEQLPPGHTLDTAPRPLSSVTTTFSVPAAGSGHDLHSGTVAQGFVPSGTAGMEGKGSRGAGAAAIKPFWLQEASLPSHPWGQQHSPGGSAEVTSPLEGCICCHLESQESSYSFCALVLKNSWLFSSSASPRNQTVPARDTSL